MKRLLAGLLLLVASCTDGPVAPEARNEQLNYMLVAKGKPSSNAPKFSISDASCEEDASRCTLVITKTGSARSASVVHVRTSNRTALSGSDYVVIDQDVSFSKSTASATINVLPIDDAIHESTEILAVNITAGSNATIVDNQGIVTIIDNDSAAPTTKLCADGSTIPIADSCPETPPADPENPTPDWEQVTDGLNGLTGISSNFDVTTTYTTGNPIPIAQPSVETVGAFRFICGAGKLAYVDPIVVPGESGSSKTHLHQFYGNDSVDENSTYSSLRAAGGSTCNNISGNTTAGNRSAYWMPAMLVGASRVWKPDYVSLYYKRRPASDPKCTASNFQAQGNCVPVPNGLKFIFGYDMVTGNTPTGFLWFNCQGVGSVSGHFATINEAMANCPVGAQFGAIIEAPDCWDGKNVDSPNHRDHVAYAGYGDWGYFKCPSTHPYVIPAFTLGAWYTVTTEVRNSYLANTLRFSSDDMHPSEPHGKTFHADFFMAWDPAVRNFWENGCINLKLNCSAGQLGDGKQLKGSAVPTYGWKNLTPVVDAP